MLDISKPLTSGKVCSYYREQYSAAANNYYSQNGELPGRWHGALVPVFGLEGSAVTAEAFDRLAEGRHPKTGEQLIRHRTPTKEPASAGWRKNAGTWCAHLEDRYARAIMDGRPLFSGADALPEPGAERRELGGLPLGQYTERQKKLIEMHTIAARIFRENLESAGGESGRNYLEARGIDASVSAEFGLGLAVGRTKQIYKALEHYGPDLLEASGLFYKTASGRLLDRFQGRIMIPIQDADGNVAAFAGRSIHDNPKIPKYLNSPGTELYKKSEVLFNAHRAAAMVGEDSRVVAVEGYMDAMAAHKVGVAAVAIGSATVTEGQARQLGALAQTVVLNLDSDDAGKRGARRSLDVLMAEGIQARIAEIHPNLGKDPDEMVTKAQHGAELFRGNVSLLSRSGIEWVSDQWQQKLEKLDPERDDRAQIQLNGMRDVIALLEKAPERLRADLSKRLAAFLGERAPEAKEEKKTQLDHRAGWDLTFNAPKTVSVTALVGGDERVREAHQFAVKKALDATERYAQARIGGSRPAQNTEKWIAALFDHDTARPVGGYPAPHLHTHSVVFNMTEDDAGQSRSLQPYEIFKVQSLATAIYQSELAYRLRNFGYEITRGANNAPDIKGYTAEYLGHESLRTQEIKSQMEALGLIGREAESILKHRHRESKILYTPDELRELHRRHAEEHGNQPEKVVAEALGRVRRAENEVDVSERVARAVNYARERLSERNSVFDHFEVLRDALHHARGRVRLERIEGEIQRQWDEGRFTKVDHVRRLAPGHRFTTPEAIAAERGMIEQVLASARAVRPLPIEKETIRERYSKLNDEQKWLVYRALTGREQILGVQGSAGTGKTTVLRAVRELAEAQGYRVHGLGPTSKARQGVVDAGIESETVQRYLLRNGARRGEDSQPVLFVLDESSLVATRQMNEFFATVQPNDRVLVIGDRKQHQSIEAGRAFEQLQNAGMRVITLQKIVRQKDESLRKTVEMLRSGRVQEAVQELESAGRLKQVRHRGHRLEAIAKNYVEDPDGALVISPDNNSRRELNGIIREKMREAGKLGEDAAEITILIPRQDVTGADRAVAASYRVGDAVRYLKGSELLEIEAKSYGAVKAVDIEKNEVTIGFGDGREVTYDPTRLMGVTLYEQEIRKFAVGDRIQWTAPWRNKGISTRDTATLTEIDVVGNIRARLDEGGRIVSWNARSNRHIDHAYAMTSYAAQGATVDRVLVHIDASDSRNRALINQTLGYVAISRPRYDAQIYTDSKEQIAYALSRLRMNTTALAPEQTAEYKGRTEKMAIEA